MVIFVGQLGKVLGIPVEKGPFFQTIASVMQGLDSIHWLTLGVSLVTLAILIGLPRLKVRISAPLVTVAVGIALSAVAGLDARGVEFVGEIPSGLPSLSLPDLSLIGQLLPGALGIALMSFTESIAAARSFQTHSEPDPDANQELLALGIANIGGGLSQAFPAGGGTSQTAVNDQAGAKSQIAEIITAATVIVSLLFLSGLIGQMPQATLGALVLVAAAGLIKLDEFRKIGQIRIHELAWAIATLAGVVLLGTLQGILVAVLLSMLDLVYQANHPQVYEVRRKPGTGVFRPAGDHPGDEHWPGLLLLRTEGRLYFANMPRVRERLRAIVSERPTRVLVLDCSAIPDIEYTALKQLAQAEERLHEAGTTLWLAALNPEALRAVESAPLGTALGHERMFFNLEQAVTAYQGNAE
jgi:SulP family sulfate permease